METIQLNNKYAIDSIVWIIRDNKPKEVKVISCIVLTILPKNTTTYRYIMEGDKVFTYPENVVFASKDELISYLSK